MKDKLTRNLITGQKEVKHPFKEDNKNSLVIQHHITIPTSKKNCYLSLKSKKISQKKLPRNDSDNESGKDFF